MLVCSPGCISLYFWPERDKVKYFNAKKWQISLSHSVLYPKANSRNDSLEELVLSVLVSSTPHPVRYFYLVYIPKRTDRNVRPLDSISRMAASDMGVGELLMTVCVCGTGWFSTSWWESDYWNAGRHNGVQRARRRLSRKTRETFM